MKYFKKISIAFLIVWLEILKPIEPKRKLNYPNTYGK